MVRRALVGLAAAAAILALSTCALFTDSLFPWYLSGVTDTLDLSEWIDDKLVPEEMSVYDWSVELSVLRDSSGSDYVFVAVQGYQNSRLIILNSDLSLVLAIGVNPIDGLPLGRRAMVDANNDYLIGSQIITNPSLLPGANIPGGWDDVGFSTGAWNCLFGVNNGVSPAMLFFERWDAGWAGPTSVSAAVSTNPDDRWDLTAAVYDAQRPAGQKAVLLLRSWGGEEESEGRIVYVSEVDLEAATIGDPVLGYPGFSVTPRRGVERMYYTRKGVVVRHNDAQATLYRFSEKDSTPINFGTRHDIIDAYDIDGEHFYVVDKDERMMYRGRTGW